MATEISRRSYPIAVTLVAAVLCIVTACTSSEPINDSHGRGLATGAGDAGSGGTASASGEGTAGAGSSSGAAGDGQSAGSAGSTGSSGAGAGSGSAGTGVAGKTGSGTAGTGAAGSKVDAGGSSTDAATVDGPVLTYSGVIGNMLIQNCGGCHFAAPSVQIQGGFSFSYENVTGVVTSGNKNCAALDASKRRAVPGHPENSLIYIKANVGTPPSGCGGHMPFSGGQLGAQVLGTLRDWILQGAKP